MAPRAPATFPPGAAAWYSRGKAGRASTRQTFLPRLGRCIVLLDGGDVPAPKTTNLGRKKRKRRQRCKEAYLKAREDAQLAGIIPTVPEGAVRNEVAPVASDPPLYHLVRVAINNN